MKLSSFSRLIHSLYERTERHPRPNLVFEAFLSKHTLEHLDVVLETLDLERL